jgi:hypothetical protein
VSEGWTAQLDDLPPTVEADLTTVPGLATALRVMAALLLLPAIRPARCLACEDDDEDGDEDDEDGDGEDGDGEDW